MTRSLIRRLAALLAAAVLLLCACAPAAEPPESGPLTIGAWGGYDDFLALLSRTHPDIQVERSIYAGANHTGYSWAQMRADDIPDIFITSQILDRELARERLTDLSAYPFVDGLSTTALDQVAIDGGVYLLPVSCAMYGILYNKTLMEEHGWQIPENFSQLEALCGDIKAAGLIPGVLGTQLTGVPFSAVFNLAKTGWLTTPDGVAWERAFLAGEADAQGMWEETMDYVQRYIDIGMFYTDPEDRGDPTMVLDYLGGRKAVFCTVVQPLNITQLPETGDQLGMMPYISEDGGKNIYMYSPTTYIGISRRLTEPGNEKKLEQAVRLLSLLYSPEGQAAMINDQTPCVMSVLDSSALPEDALIYDAQQALRVGRAFPMTYTGWEGVLSDIGQAYKDWFRETPGMDGPQCIARMDELQRGSLAHAEQLYFCRSTADFTLEETGVLLGKALGSAVGADMVMVPLGVPHSGPAQRPCVTGKLYQGKISSDIAATITPTYDGEYAMMTMTGAQAKALAREGFDFAGGGTPCPYLLVTRGGVEPEDGATYQVAFFMRGYTEEVGAAYSARVEKGSLRAYLRAWLEQEETVSPGGNPWE